MKPVQITTPNEPDLRGEAAEMLLGQWWVRALLATENDTLGAILRAATGLQSKRLVVFGPRCTILDDSDEKNQDLWLTKDGTGVVWCNVLRPGALGPASPEPICTAGQFARAVQTLIDNLDLSREEAEALVKVCQAWVGTDWRLNAGNLPADRGIN
jgi:hypothetical protein